MGAFFGAMTLRAETFPPPTQWSEGEKRAMAEKWPELQKVLPSEVQFLADPEGTLLEGLSPVGPSYTGHSGRAEERLVGDLREVRISPYYMVTTLPKGAVKVTFCQMKVAFGSWQGKGKQVSQYLSNRFRDLVAFSFHFCSRLAFRTLNSRTCDIER